MYVRTYLHTILYLATHAAGCMQAYVHFLFSTSTPGPQGVPSAGNRAAGVQTATGEVEQAPQGISKLVLPTSATSVTVRVRMCVCT